MKTLRREPYAFRYPYVSKRGAAVIWASQKFIGHLEEGKPFKLWGNTISAQSWENITTKDLCGLLSDLFTRGAQTESWARQTQSTFMRQCDIPQDLLSRGSGVIGQMMLPMAHGTKEQLSGLFVIEQRTGHKWKMQFPHPDNWNYYMPKFWMHAILLVIFEMFYLINI